MTQIPRDRLAELESMSSWAQSPDAPLSATTRSEGIEEAARGRLGQLIACRWRLQKLIGLGGMGAVYEARHRTGRRVAIKVMHGHLLGDRKLQKRFIREAYVVNALDHPAIVPVHDAGVDDTGAPFLVMDLLEGQTLEAMRTERGGALPAFLVLDIAERLLDALAVAHGHGIIHRDIKPANLFSTTRGELKVLDFGIAGSRERSSTVGTHTRSGSLLGTPAFASPEQARGRFDEVDHQSDIWSVGATLFTLLTGETVHVADNANELWGQAMSVSARSLRSVVPDTPEELIAAVDGALRYDKRERWTGAKEMRAAVLRAIASSLPAGGTSHGSKHSTCADLAPRDLGRFGQRTVSAARTWASVALWRSPGLVPRRWLLASLAVIPVAISGSRAWDSALVARNEEASEKVSVATPVPVTVAPGDGARPELDGHPPGAQAPSAELGEPMEHALRERPRLEERARASTPAATPRPPSRRTAVAVRAVKPASRSEPASPALDTARHSDSSSGDLLDLWR